jgi:hypothetical protein
VGRYLPSQILHTHSSRAGDRQNDASRAFGFRAKRRGRRDDLAIEVLADVGVFEVMRIRVEMLKVPRLVRGLDAARYVCYHRQPSWLGHLASRDSQVGQNGAQHTFNPRTTEITEMALRNH